jgi:glycosyltransferase involved in cell wall biosynthesis
MIVLKYYVCCDAGKTEIEEGLSIMQRPSIQISILIPTWNRVQPVLDAVESIGPLAHDMEVVIVDNASDPDLYEELQHHLGSRPGIRLFRNESNLGMVRNWNRCLELAQGEWFGLLCSDDRFRLGAIDRLREIIGMQPGPSMIIQDPAADREVVFAQAGSVTLRELRLPIASGNFWHRCVYQQIGGFDERFEYCADAEYWYRAVF